MLGRERPARLPASSADHEVRRPETEQVRPRHRRPGPARRRLDPGPSARCGSRRDGGNGTSFKNGDTEKRRQSYVLCASHRQRPMPARPSAGPSDHSTPRGRKLLMVREQLVSVGCRVIARRVAAASADPVTTPQPSRSILPPFLRVSVFEARSVSLRPLREPSKRKPHRSRTRLTIVEVEPAPSAAQVIQGVAGDGGCRWRCHGHSLSSSATADARVPSHPA